ncbi:hypothetical protein Tco_1563699 [Tanacetum coccineum]
MSILHSIEENELEYEDEDEVEIKMMRTEMDKEFYEDSITPIICHNFSPTSNPPIKPKDSGNMEMKPDIENMTIREYLEYKAVKERRLWDDVRSRRSPTYYNEADIDSFHRNKSKTFSYPYSHNLTPQHPCFLPIQPYPKNYFVPTNESNDGGIHVKCDRMLSDLGLRAFLGVAAMAVIPNVSRTPSFVIILVGPAVAGQGWLDTLLLVLC